MTNNNNKSALAFLIGAAVGGATALLLAPKSGAEARRRLAQGARDMKVKTRDKAELLKGAVSDAKTAYREKLDNRHETQFDFARGRMRAGIQPPGAQSPDAQS
jgi:gas vesicle protein